MGRKHSSKPRMPYTFRLDQDNVEVVRGTVANLSEWVDEKFREQVLALGWTDNTKNIWRKWLGAQPDEIKSVATAYPPTCLYKQANLDQGDRYIIRSYDLSSEGDVTLTLQHQDGSGITHGVKPSDIQPA